MEVNLIFPNQLFRDGVLINNSNKTFLIEEFMFFRHFKFHKQKILFHRMSMKKYESFLKSKNIDVEYIDSYEEISDIRLFFDKMESIKSINIYDPEDNWLEKRIIKACSKNNIKVNVYENQLFITKKIELDSFFRADKKKFFQTNCYKSQRLKFNILMEGGKPEGGKWTYDDMNREKYPKDKTPPNINYVETNDDYESAKCYIEKNFNHNPGKLNVDKIYQYDFHTADSWFEAFLIERYDEFGPYEDAVVKEKSVLNHSVLSPIINSGLLNPKLIMEKSVKFYNDNDIRLNSCEGFIRQIIGWREFIKGVYDLKGVDQENSNYFNHSKKLKDCWYEGSTGIDPLDKAIKESIDHGYTHHINRLMVIANIMNLAGVSPKEIYTWFMEMYLDSSEWVMVPNVFGMSTYADAGIMSTKPYICGSNYLLKMSDFKRGDWCEVVDGLYWSFIFKHSEFFKSNPRLSLMTRSLDKMNKDKKERIFKLAEDFISLTTY